MPDILNNTSYFFNLYALPNLFTAMDLLITGIFVYLLNRRALLNFTFLALCLTCVVWQFGYCMAFLSVHEDVAWFWIRFAYCGLVFIPAHIYAFAAVYLSLDKQKKFVWLAYIACFASLIFVNSAYVIGRLQLFFWGYYETAGPLYWLFMLIFFSVALAGLVNLYQGFRQEKFAPERKRIRLLFFAFTSAILGGVDFLAAYGINVYPFSYILVIICLGIIGYSVLRYKVLTPAVAADAIIASLGDGLILLAPDTTIRSVNSAALGLLGYKPEELIGEPISKIFVEDKIFKGPKWQRLLEQGRVHDDSVYFLTRDEQSIPMSFTATLLKEGGQIVGIVGIARDIREMVAYIKNLDRAYKQLKETQEKLIRSEQLAVIGQLAAIISHELRNPLGVIKNAVYFLKSKIPIDDQRLKDYVVMIEQEIKRSDKIIADLLTFTRLSKPDLKPISMNLILKDVWKTLSMTDSRVDIEKQFNLQEDLPLIKGDADQLRQVFINLITNGLQAMPEGGMFAISAVFKDDFIEVRVKDTGSGISRDNLERVFSPFFTTKPSGIGLGLAVCQRIINDHRGEIRIETAVNQGTTFIVTLPIAGK